MKESLESHRVELVAGYENGDDQPNLNQCELERIAHGVKPFGNGKAQPPDHGAHGDIQKGYGKDGRDDELGPQGPNLLILAHLILIDGLIVLYFQRGIARLDNGLLDFRQTHQGGAVGQGGPFGGQIDGDTLYACHFAKYPFNAAGAGGAGHSLNGEGHFLGLYLILGLIPGLFDSSFDGVL